MEKINTRLTIISGMALIFTAHSHLSSGRENRSGTPIILWRGLVAESYCALAQEA
jgi:hypothetical protein